MVNFAAKAPTLLLGKLKRMNAASRTPDKCATCYGSHPVPRCAERQETYLQKT